MAPITVLSSGSVAGGSGLTSWSAKGTFIQSIGSSLGFEQNSASIATLTGTSAALGQSFIANTSGVIDLVFLNVHQQNTPADNVYVEIQTDSSDKPSGTVIGTSAQIAASSLSSTFSTDVEQTRFIFYTTV